MQRVLVIAAVLGLMCVASCSDDTGVQDMGLDAAADLPAADIPAADTVEPDSGAPDSAQPDAGATTQVQWVITGGGPEDEYSDFGDGLVLDAQGNAYITCTYQDTVTLGASTMTCTGDRCGFVAKVSPAGKVLWVTEFGGAAAANGLWLHGICIDAQGSPYVTAYFWGSIQIGSTTVTTTDNAMLVAKLAPADGTALWAVHASSAAAASCAVDTGGEVYVAGGFGNEITLGTTTLTSTGDNGVFVTRLDPGDGAFLWATSFGGTGGASVYSMATGPDGAVHMVGGFDKSITVGSTTRTAAGDIDMFAVKLSSTGTPEWLVTGGGPKGDLLYGVAVDSSGEVYVGGGITGPATLGSATIPAESSTVADMVMARISSSGTVKWAKFAAGHSIFGIQYYDSVCGVALDATGRPLYTGSFSGFTDFLGQELNAQLYRQWDVLVARSSPAGVADWAVNYGGFDATAELKSVRGRSIAAASNGDVVVLGIHEGLQVGSTQLPSSGGADLFLMRLTPP